MNKIYTLKSILVPLIGLISILVSCRQTQENHAGQTVVCKWQGDKRTALSLTFDDGIITQFSVARPIMNQLDFPATFFIITGKIKGSQKGKFWGRPEEDIIQETARVSTDADNFFERASLIGFTGTDEASVYHATAGSLFESGKVDEAYKMIDEAYDKLRKGFLKDGNEVVYHDNEQDTTSWNDLKQYAAEGHEIASHTITHPRLAVLDERNLMYELQQSREDISTHLGESYTFSAECPYGTEDERVMKYAHTVYPALRNRMPADYLEELNRSSNLEPGLSEKEYVQWQRGPLSDTSIDVMRSWIDTCLSHDNIWLVLVFHGVDDFGWEPKTAEELTTYFRYIKDLEDQIWVGTFADVTKYIRERQGLEVLSEKEEDAIILTLATDLDNETYNVPLTFKTYVPAHWGKVTITDTRGQMSTEMSKGQDESGSYILYNLVPGSGQVVISGRAE